jgi:hypothetical protein
MLYSSSARPRLHVLAIRRQGREGQGRTVQGHHLSRLTRCISSCTTLYLSRRKIFCLGRSSPKFRLSSPTFPPMRTGRKSKRLIRKGVS